MEKKMSKITNHIIEQEELGLIYYNGGSGGYELTELGQLVEEKEFLEWEIARDKADLREVVRKINNLGASDVLL